jgi:hypothetical protein
MWTQLTNENIEKIMLGTLISNKNSNIVTVTNNQTSLETIYKIEQLMPSNEGVGDIIIKTDMISNQSGYPGTRIVNKMKLVEEKWFAKF